MTSAVHVGLPGMRNDVWAMVHAERRALIDDLERLDDSQWEQPSLCDGWSVHDVVAHVVASAKTTRIGFLVDMARARFDFDRQNAHGVERERAATPQETLDRFRRAATLTSTPTAPIGTRLVEAVVHAEDIRRPLGISRLYLQDAVVGALWQQARTSAAFGGAKQLLSRVRLSATDIDLSIGTGPEIRAPVLTLLLVASGRPVAPEDLTGPGVEELLASTLSRRTKKPPHRGGGSSVLR